MDNIERNIRKHKKELKSMVNKMNNSDKIWFSSLVSSKKYDILFMWKNFKFRNNLERPLVIYRKVYADSYSSEREKVKIYPPKFKHFIIGVKKMDYYIPTKKAYRKSVLKHILE
jgi:hypothetical protein